VTADEAERIRRVARARGMTEADARARIAAQADAGLQEAAADVVIRNDGDPALLEREVGELWADLRRRVERS
ncbi:MAG TPA: dephospho-CoA kinase, partial [Actinomycetota bacterium]|nr:dephospho-CoA kinase [Actinomycetota bacterium]